MITTAGAMGDAAYGIILLLGLAIPLGFVVVDARRKRRAETLTDEIIRDIAADRASVRRPYDPSSDRRTDGDDAPVWTNANEFALAEAIERLTGIGFFADLQASDLRTRVEVLGRRFRERYGRPFNLEGDFREPELAALDASRVWWRDTEADVGPGNTVYAEVVALWAAISCGRFRPEHISEAWSEDGQVVELSFQHDGESVSLRPVVHRDWLDLDVLLRLTGCLDEDFQFISVHTGDQTAYVVCVTTGQALDLRDRGWPLLGDRRPLST